MQADDKTKRDLRHQNEGSQSNSSVAERLVDTYHGLIVAHVTLEVQLIADYVERQVSVREKT